MQYVLLGILIIGISCNSSKDIAREKKTIPYIIQDNVSILLQGELDRINSKAFFILNHVAGDTFRIELIKNQNDGNPYASLSKR